MPDAKIITGTELREISDAALLQKVTKTDIFAEVEPNSKRTHYHCAQEGRICCGLYRDGINDVSALHARM